jgi:hypothetical protein
LPAGDRAPHATPKRGPDIGGNRRRARFALKRIIEFGDADLARCGGRRATLLRDVGQFVGQQLPALTRVWRELALAEHDRISYREGCGFDRTGGSSGVWPIVDPDVAEIAPKVRLRRRARGL